MKELDYFKLPDSPEDPLSADAAEAKLIISLFKQGKDARRIFIEDGIAMIKITEVAREWQRLKDELMKKISGQEVISPEVPAVLDEEGKVVSDPVPAVVFNPKDKLALEKSLSVSELFTARQIVDDVLAYDEKNPGVPQTFTQLKAKYYPKIEVEKEIIK